MCEATGRQWRKHSSGVVEQMHSGSLVDELCSTHGLKLDHLPEMVSIINVMEPSAIHAEICVFVK